MNMKLLGTLYATFFRIGLLTFGGGYAMLPMLTREVVEKRQYCTEDELLDYFAIGQCTPGIIAVNTATFVGGKLARVPGAISATLGIVSPSFVIIVLIGLLLSNFMEIQAVAHALAGIRVAVCALILATVVKLVRQHARGALAIALCLLAFALVALLSVSPVWVIAGAVAVGLCYGRVKA